MKKEEIVSQAKEAYQRNFKENKFQKEEKTEDVVLNKENLESEVKEMKETEMNKLKTLDLLRNQIVDKSQNAFHKIFHENTQQETSHHKMTSEEMREKMEKEKEDLFNSVSLMKQRELKAHH